MSSRGFIRNSWLYKKLNSVKTALLILGLMAVTMVIGTVFPQEMETSRYINSWGKELYERYNSLGLLHIFKSTWFLALTYAFSLNIVVCTYERYLSMMSRRKLKKKTQGQVFAAKGAKVEETVLHSYDDLCRKVDAFVSENGYKVHKSHLSDKLKQLIVVKGISYLLVSILFHLGIFLCVIGFMQTYLVNYEGYISIYPDEIKEVDTVGKDTRLYKALSYFKNDLDSLLGFDLDGYTLSKESKIKLAMEGFHTEYTWFNEDYYPKDWKSDIIVYDEDDNVAAKKTIEVNDPIYYEGFAFYQEAYEQSCDLYIVKSDESGNDDPASGEKPSGDGEEPIPVKPNEPFTIKGQDGRFMLGTVRVGKLFRRFKEGYEDITPNVDIYLYPPMEEPKEGEAPGKPKREKVGNLKINEPDEIKGLTLYFNNFKEATVVSYRKDAGVPILWFASIMLFIAICIRIYFPYYKLQIHIEPVDDKSSLLKAGGNSLGLLANLQKQLDKVIDTCK